MSYETCDDFFSFPYFPILITKDRKGFYKANNRPLNII